MVLSPATAIHHRAKTKIVAFAFVEDQVFYLRSTRRKVRSVSVLCWSYNVFMCDNFASYFLEPNSEGITRRASGVYVDSTFGTSGGLLCYLSVIRDLCVSVRRALFAVVC